MPHNIDKKSIERELEVLCRGFAPLNDRLVDLAEIALLNVLHKELSQQEELRNLKKLQESDLSQTTPMWLTRAFNEGQSVYKFSPGVRIKEDIFYILNWIETAMQRRAGWLEELDGKGRPVKLVKIGTLEQAKIAAEKEMRLEAQRQAANPRIEDNVHEQTVMRFDNGFRIVKMLTTDALDYESKHVGHCVGDGGYDTDLKTGKYEFYSLRDPFNRGHATMQINPGTRAITECKGKRNMPPVSKYMPYIKAFLTEQQYKLNAAPANIGLIEQDGVYYDLANLPEGFHYKDDLNIRGAVIDRLPDGMRVDGNLYLSNTSLRSLPENLYVAGDLSLSGSEITYLPRGLRVQGHLDLSCTEIEALPDEFKTDGSLSLSGSKITKLPDGFFVGEDLNATGLPITELPAEFHVGGSLHLSSTRLTSLPEGLVVNGMLDISSTPIHALPSGLKVSGELNLGSTDIRSLPDDLEVGGTLVLDNSKIDKFPEQVSFGGGISLIGCDIEELPEDLFVNGFLNISETKIKSLPKGLHVDGPFYAQKLEIKELPDDIVVTKSYHLEDSQLESLPPNFRVLGSFWAQNTNIRTLPEGLHVGQHLHLGDTDVRSLPDDITVAYIYLPGSGGWNRLDEAREWLQEQARVSRIAENEARILNRIRSNNDNDNGEAPLAAPYVIRPRP